MGSSGDTAIDKGSGVKAGDLVAGHYRVERVLGAGGMGVVVAARDERTGEDVAVKLLRSVDDTRAVERFFREARAMGKLDSEHVVRVRDAGNDGHGKPYLVMDRLDGIDLSERTKRSGPLGVSEAADYALQACEALSHAHAKGIVHRDIKPSNLFLHRARGAEQGTLKVLDFGISKVQTRDAWERTLTTTDDGGVLGSPPYMSPEQVRDPKTVDSRSDIWSLGVVLYKLLSGKVPYDGDSVGEVFSKILERPYPPLRVTTEVPAEVDAIVERCLTKDRDARFPHVGDLALALAPFASPSIAALAPRIAQRMHDEGPTLAQPPTGEPFAARPTARREPSTLTSAPPPALAPASASASAPASASASAPAFANTGSVSLDVPPPAPRRGRMVAILLAVLGVAAGIAIGFTMRGNANAAAKASASANASANATATANTSPSAAPPPPPASLAVESPPPLAAPSPSTTSRSPSGRPRPGRRNPPITSAATAPATAVTVSAPPPPPPATTSRPELQPSPYPTPP